jgi:eukaryotic-like serine/threonine-protein kinase
MAYWIGVFWRCFMGSFLSAARRHRTAISLGLAAAIAVCLPPFHLAARADGKIYDLWSRMLSVSAPADIVIVSLDDPEWLTTLAEIANRDSARLLVSTLPDPPSPFANDHVLGPTALAIDNRILTRTEWARGGHLWFDPQIDGVVRQDVAHLGSDAELPSLAFAAASAVRGSAPEPGGSRWPRFYSADSFAELGQADVLAAPMRVHDKILIAGTSDPAYVTPVGRLSSRDLLAQVLAGYRDGMLVSAGVGGHVVAWTLALLCFATAVRRPRWLGRWSVLVPFAGVGGELALSAGAYSTLSMWIPPAAPLVWLLVGGTLQSTGRLHRRHRGGTVADIDAARAAFAAGDLDHAWALYKSIPPVEALLGELYELGAALERQGAREHAADIFHRVALVDAHFQDVARRLVAATHAEPITGQPEEVRGHTLSVLGRYEILGLIGQGSTGKVFLGRDPQINRLLAIKVIDLRAECEPAELDEATERFHREVETAGRLNHPNIVTIFDVGEADGLAYIAMEYLTGRHLSDFTRPDTLLPSALVLELMAQTADALAYAHGQNVVHRDIKPANIMYDSVAGRLKITDFGIARLIDVSRTRTGIVLGTPSFMAPEQLEGKNVNGHTDLFALGVTLYELLTGRLPFRGASMTKLMFVIANEPHERITAVRPELPVQLDSLVDTALAKKPEDRFRSGADMADALRAAAAQLS